MVGQNSLFLPGIQSLINEMNDEMLGSERRRKKLLFCESSVDCSLAFLVGGLGQAFDTPR